MRDILRLGNKIIVIIPSKIENKYPGGYEQWKIDNPDYIDNIQLPVSTCTHQKIIVDLSGFDDSKVLFEWLKLNSDYFCYAESYKYIENSHNINLFRSYIDDQIEEQITNLINLDINKPNAYVITLKDIMSKYNLDFDGINYEKMILIDLTLINKYKYELDMSPKDSLIVVGIYYSFPFFKSIINNHNINDFEKCVFYFAKVKIGEKETIAFKVKYFDTEIAGYYDYSTIPGGGGGAFMSHKLENISLLKNLL